MTMPYQLQFGTYLFPNQSFELLEHRIDIDTPVNPIRRRDGGVVQEGFLTPKRWRINGKIYGTDKGTVHNDLNNLYKSLHHNGVGASFFYRDDRYVFAQLGPGGIVATPEAKGLYEYDYLVDIVLVSDAFSESVNSHNHSAQHNNGTEVLPLSVGGNFPTQPIFVFVGGTMNFGIPIRVENAGSSYYWQFSNGLLAGQTLIVDCVAGSVLYQQGLTMMDGMSFFGGYLDFPINPGDSLTIAGGTFNYSINYRDRWYL